MASVALGDVAAVKQSLKLPMIGLGQPAAQLGQTLKHEAAHKSCHDEESRHDNSAAIEFRQAGCK